MYAQTVNSEDEELEDASKVIKNHEISMFFGDFHVKVGNSNSDVADMDCVIRMTEKND